MSFLKKLFGGGSSGGAGAAKPAKQIDHNGYMIAATPYKEDGQWQTCGVISKAFEGVTREHRFIRADRFSDQDAAADHAIMKGQQIADQLGDRMFG